MVRCTNSTRHSAYRKRLANDCQGQILGIDPEMAQMTSKTQNMAFTVVKRTVLYARTSANDTVRDSLTTQLEVCEQHANEQGYIIIARLQEDVRGVKGDDRNAPALNKALEMARAGLFEILTIRDVKRYSRDIYKAIDFERLFYECGVEIEYAWNKELNGLPRNGTGTMIRFMQYWASEQDRIGVVKQLYAKKIDAVRKGDIMTHGKPPYGYRETCVFDGRKKRRTLVIYEEEAKWIIKIFEWYVNEGLSLRGIIARLRENCVSKPSVSNPEAKQNTGKRGPFNWSQTTLREILIRRAYIGEWEYSKDKAEKRWALEHSLIAEVIPEDPASTECPPIVDPKLFKEAQIKLQQNQQRTHKKSAYEFLMRGRATCGLCGYACRCIAKKWKNYTYLRYVCNPRQSRIPHPETNKLCTLPQMKQAVIDTEVWEWLKQLINDDAELKKGYEDYLANKETKFEPLRNEMRRIDAGLIECKQKLVSQTQALVLLKDIGSVQAVDVIKHDILHIEDMINRYNSRKREIEIELSNESVSEDLITNFEGFIASIREGLKMADNDFNLRRKIVETLNVTVTLTVEDGEPIFYPQCILKLEDKPLLYNDPRTG